MRLGILASLCAGALAALPAAAQRPGDPLSVRNAVPRPYERAYAWYPYIPAGDVATDGESPQPTLLVAPFGGTGFNLARVGTLGAGLRSPLSLRGDDATPAGAYIGYRYSRWTVISGVRQSADSEQSLQGTRLDLGASYGFSVTPRHLITLAGSLTMGQPRAPGLPPGAYSSSNLTTQNFRAGEPGMGLRLSWIYSLRGNLFVDTSLGYDRLQASTDSLQGFERSSATLGTTFGYRW